MSSYAPSKGFRPSELARDRKKPLPVELGFPKNMLAETAGIPEPEGLREVVHKWSDGSLLIEPVTVTFKNEDGTVTEIAPVHKEAWNAVARGLRALTGSTHAIHEERKLSRNQAKAAKQRMKTLIIGRARWLLKIAEEVVGAGQIAKNEAVLMNEALEIAEDESFALIALQEERGFKVDSLVYKLQDNSKTKPQIVR